MNQLDENWHDWRWQLRNQASTVETLAHHLALTEEERTAITALADRFRLGVTPYYLSLIDPEDPGCPIRRQAIPTLAEGVISPGERPDPLSEERDMPLLGLTRRYPNRVLLYVTHTCAVYCRHCTRRRKVGDPASNGLGDALTQAIDWIVEHPEIDDVVLSGGDPLSLSDRRLEQLLEQLHPHTRMIRLGTRHPTTLPQRITPALCRVLARFPPLYVMTHFNHPRECTPAAATALARLVDAGCVLANQSVLLKGINDDAAVLTALHDWLLAHRCRPYRLYHCDFEEGLRQFRVPLSEGHALLTDLRERTSGLAMPEYVVDLPGGHGKALVASGVRENDRWIFEAWDGHTVVLTTDGLDGPS